LDVGFWWALLDRLLESIQAGSRALRQDFNLVVAAIPNPADQPQRFGLPFHEQTEMNTLDPAGYEKVEPL
jgi:hypothetical protein